MLREPEARLPEIGKLMLRDRYGARERHLHEMVFYEGNIDVEDIRSVSYTHLTLPTNREV